MDARDLAPGPWRIHEGHLVTVTSDDWHLNHRARLLDVAAAVAGAELAALGSYLSDARPASDAPVAEFPGHRRDNAILPGEALAAALPRPPLFVSAVDVR